MGGNWKSFILSYMRKQRPIEICARSNTALLLIPYSHPRLLLIHPNASIIRISWQYNGRSSKCSTFVSRKLYYPFNNVKLYIQLVSLYLPSKYVMVNVFDLDLPLDFFFRLPLSKPNFSHSPSPLS